MKTNRLVIVALMALLAATGCSSKAEKRAAIEKALAYDSQIADKRSTDYVEKAGFWGTLFGDSQAAATARRNYVARLRTIPLDGCPSDFVKAYREHIKAWEADDSPAIKSTWDRVIWTAYKYGVAEK